MEMNERESNRMPMNKITRPEPRVVNHFEVAATSSGLVMGDFKWAVLSGIAIIHDGLSRHEAEVVARALNVQLDGFRKMVGLAPLDYQQLSLFLPPMALAGPVSLPEAVKPRPAEAPRVSRKARAA
jgi:hypothetical protein